MRVNFEHNFRPASIKVMQRSFKPLNRERYPGGPPFAESSNRRTAPFEGAYVGASPAPAASLRSSSFGSVNHQQVWATLSRRSAPREGGCNSSPGSQFPPGGEIELRLAYTQKSKGQNLPGRPTFALRAAARRAIASWRNQERAGL